MNRRTRIATLLVAGVWMLACDEPPPSAVEPIQEQMVAVQGDACSSTAHDLRRTLRMYDATLRDVARLGADGGAITALNDAYEVLAAEHATLLVTCDDPGNTPPFVTIASPTDGAGYQSGATIEFAGSASDAEDGELTNAIRWRSSIDMSVGVGGSFFAVLTDGNHTITAEVTDSDGATRAASVQISVGPGAALPIAVASIDPAIVFAGLPTPVVLRATDPLPSGAVGFQSGATVTFVDQEGFSTTVGALFVDASTIQAVTPLLAAGDAAVTVTNPDGSSGILPGFGLFVTDNITVPLESVDPTTWTAGTTQVVTILGETPLPPGGVGFQAGAIVQLVSPNFVTIASNVVFVDAATLQATIDSATPTGVYDVLVINPDGTSGVLPSAVSITP